jgi:recombination protein RecA
MYGKGISKAGEIIDLGVQNGFVEKAGAWFSAEGERIGQGRENAKQYLLDNSAMMEKISNKIRENAGLVAENMLLGQDEAKEEAPSANDTSGNTEEEQKSSRKTAS